MKDQGELQRQEMEKWQDQWQKAVDDGVFEGAPKPASPKTGTSFFGCITSKSEDSEVINEVDAQYWKSIAEMGADGNVPDPIEASKKMIEREQDQDVIIHETKEQEEVGKVARTILKSPNPVRHHSVGKDQDLTPQSLSSTFSEEDIESLHELKIQLHNAQCMLSSNQIEGKSTKSVETKINNLKQKIDELSDAMGQIFPLAIGQQGD